MLEDRFGYRITTSSADAVDYYIAALDSLFAMQPDCMSLAEASLAADPGLVVAHCVYARALVMASRTKDAIGVLETAEGLAEASSTLSDRERAHLAIVALVTRGATAEALPLVLDHAKAYPRDALPLSFAVGVYGLYGFGGYVNHHQVQLELLQSVEAHWDEDWWFLSSLGWSYVEAGQPDVGVPLLDRSLELNNANAAGAHGRTHGFYELGQAELGERFIADWLPSYATAGPLHCHLAWHQALFALQQGNIDGAWAVYHRHVKPAVSQALPMFTMIDCAALLWRLRLQGCEIDDALVADVVDFLEARFPATEIPFANVHASLAYALAGNTDGLAERLAKVAELVAEGKQNSGELVSWVCRGIEAFSRGDANTAVAELDRARATWSILGGSNAQRDVLFETLISAHALGGDLTRAESLAAERAASRAGHLDGSWLQRFVSA